MKPWWIGEIFVVDSESQGLVHPSKKFFSFLIVSGIITFPLLEIQSKEVQSFQSLERQSSLLELYTSEGCSSCPPADRWLSTLSSDPELWKTIVPVAFHVDYWDYIGWKDPFAKPEYTARQRAYASVWDSETIYTPGFVINGREWRNWRGSTVIQPRLVGSPGKLKTVVHDRKRVKVTFYPKEAEQKKWIAHIALLGMNLKSDVRAGENRGRDLKHDFVALEWNSMRMKPRSDMFFSDFKFPSSSIDGDLALAVWITEKGSPYPIQATGGFLD